MPQIVRKTASVELGHHNRAQIIEWYNPAAGKAIGNTRGYWCRFPSWWWKVGNKSVGRENSGITGRIGITRIICFSRLLLTTSQLKSLPTPDLRWFAWKKITDDTGASLKAPKRLDVIPDRKSGHVGPQEGIWSPVKEEEREHLSRKHEPRNRDVVVKKEPHPPNTSPR